MGRFLMYATIALLAVFVLSSYVVLKHGGEGLGQVKSLSVGQLMTGANAYNGSVVTVDGTLIYDREQRAYELTGRGADYPIPLTGVSDDVLLPFANQEVRVNGKFFYHNQNGSNIEVATISRVEPASPSEGAGS